MRELTPAQIDVDDLPAHRELLAAMTMLRLLRSTSDTNLAVAVACQNRGFHRILRLNDAVFFARLVRILGVERAWALGVRSGFFLHIDRPILPGFALNLNTISDCDCRSMFRFDHDGIKRLVVLLRIPEAIILPTYGDRYSSLEGICILLFRMSYPRRWKDLEPIFNRHSSSLCRIFHYMMHRILHQVKNRIMFSRALSRHHLQSLVTAFWRRGVPQCIKIFSVIDVKKVPNCRPTHGQRAQFSGHKKVHCFKYQTLQTPDGIILHCHNCEDGRRGDGYILRASNLIDFLRSRLLFADHFVFADSAYPNNDVMMSMFRGRALPPWATAFNNAMAKVRVSVEWGYQQVCQHFAFVNWKMQLKIELMNVEAIWHMAVFLTNCLTCHWGRNQISDFFQCAPPSLEEYLAELPAFYG